MALETRQQRSDLSLSLPLRAAVLVPLYAPPPACYLGQAPMSFPVHPPPPWLVPAPIYLSHVDPSFHLLHHFISHRHRPLPLTCAGGAFVFFASISDPSPAPPHLSPHRQTLHKCEVVLSMISRQSSSRCGRRR